MCSKVSLSAPRRDRRVFAVGHRQDGASRLIAGVEGTRCRTISLRDAMLPTQRRNPRVGMPSRTSPVPAHVGLRQYRERADRARIVADKIKQVDSVSKLLKIGIDAARAA